ncbi:pyrimidine 5'-nucleotidase [Burkholderiaceae bacterium DAT-1]|nr:pyrimidine 5'-nucleotidase [Burkholderiaceae bacterium DAT-1]
MPPIWLFDLDNTLHDADHWVFPEMNRLMTQYMMTHLQLDHPTALSLHHHYWRHYGTTLNGLMRHHQHIDPEHFLEATHPDPVAAQRLIAIAGAREILPALPGRKFLFTNAQRNYAVRVLDGLGLRHQFEAIISIGDLRYLPKPQQRAYLHVLQRHHLDPHRCIMVEDSRNNLLTAKRLGMRTVWLTRSLTHHPLVDVKIRTLHDLLRWQGRCQHRHLVVKPQV